MLEAPMSSAIIFKMEYGYCYWNQISFFGGYLSNTVYAAKYRIFIYFFIARMMIIGNPFKGYLIAIRK